MYQYMCFLIVASSVFFFQFFMYILIMTLFVYDYFEMVLLNAEDRDLSSSLY